MAAPVPRPAAAKQCETAPMSGVPPRAAGRVAAVAAVVNGGVVVSLWWRSGGVDDVHDAPTALAGAGRVAGLLGAYLALVALVLLARLPALERWAGFERLLSWHRWTARGC